MVCIKYFILLQKNNNKAMFEELKIKNNELKEIINKIEELTPWDREQLFEEISHKYEKDYNTYNY